MAKRCLGALYIGSSSLARRATRRREARIARLQRCLRSRLQFSAAYGAIQDSCSAVNARRAVKELTPPHRRAAIRRQSWCAGWIARPLTSFTASADSSHVNDCVTRLCADLEL
jgi:hypothetical protein